MITPFLPMLATAAQPFDSPDHIFEVKWDGIRALAGIAADHWRLWGRGLTDYTARYPELAVLRRWPAGTIVDGELVVFVQGRPDLSALLRRHQLADGPRRQAAARHTPVCYVLFDLLAQHDRSLLRVPLAQRREELAGLMARLQEPLVRLSEGQVGCGRQVFARVVAQGQEGIMAKHLASLYQPGRRSPAWQKIKPEQALACVIIGYTASGLRLATLRQGQLAYVGTVRQGLTPLLQEELRRRLAGHRQAQPVVACPQSALWVQPLLYCQVRCFGWTTASRLRYPVFQGLLEGGPAAEPTRPDPSAAR